jgi:Uma2 family endonuclease
MFTYEDLLRQFPDETLYQLFEGELVMTPSPVRRHQEILNRLVLNLALPPEAKLYFAPFDVVLSPTNVAQPDLLVILAANRAILQDVVRGAPDLVLEVLSPSTESLGRKVKLEVYARFGVTEYWIVDGECQTVEIYRQAASGIEYELAAALGLGDRAETPLLPALDLDVAALFTEL